MCLGAWGQRGPSMPGSRFPRYHRHQDTVNTGHCHARPGCTQPINTLFVIWNPEFISQVRSIKIIDVRSKRQLFFVFRLSALVCAGPGETGERSCYSRGKVRYQRERGEDAGGRCQEMANLELHVYVKWSGYRVSYEEAMTAMKGKVTQCYHVTDVRRPHETESDVTSC